MSQTLRDLFEGTSFILDESKSGKFEGILATVKGPFGLTEDENRNGRIYTNQFWESILSKPEVRARISERAVIGELEHPNSIQTQLGHISHVVTEMRVIPDRKELYGEADILDTPSGRILHTLFKAGVKVGISSRGAGSLIERDAEGSKKKKYVNENDYVFGGFDFVSDPSAPNAFPKLAEGQVEELAESLAPHQDQIKRDPTFYATFLTPLGVTSLREEDTTTTLSEDTTPDSKTDLDERDATIADLRSKMRQMAERHQELASEVGELREMNEVEDLRLQCDTYSRASRENHSRADRAQKHLARVTGYLQESRKSLDEFTEESSLKERDLTMKVTSLQGKIQKAEQSILEGLGNAQTLEGDLVEARQLTASKMNKLTSFRKELLESMSEHFNCDLKALVEGLKPGFTPLEAVLRSVECSRNMGVTALPLGEGSTLQVEDLTQDPEDAEKTKIRNRRVDFLRKTSGQKN